MTNPVRKKKKSHWVTGTFESEAGSNSASGFRQDEKKRFAE